MNGTNSPKIGIIGAGIIGLSAAVELQRQFPAAEITIIAASFSPDLTSDVAGAIWRPYSSVFTEKGLERKVLSAAFRRYTELYKNPDCGIIRQSGYEVTKDENLTEQPFMEFVFGLRRLKDEEFNEFGNEYKKGWFYTTYGIQTTVFLGHLTERFNTNGGKFVQRQLSTLDEVQDDYDVIVNCSGLGARNIAGDLEVRPVRGQIVRVKCAGINHFFMDDDDYLLLNRDFIVLGGTHDENNWDLSVNGVHAKRILEKHGRLFPRIREAEIVSHHVGLRPYREKIRLEKEVKKNKNGKKVLIIHNYGHGGSGVTLSLGCAEHVGSIVSEEMGWKKAKAQL